MDAVGRTPEEGWIIQRSTMRDTTTKNARRSCLLRPHRQRSSTLWTTGPLRGRVVWQRTRAESPDGLGKAK
jgi:hypothetical protein